MKTTLTPILLHALWILSDRPTYAMYNSLGCSEVSFVVGAVLGCLVQFWVYTDLYTHYSSHNPSIKSGMIRCLARRAETVYDGRSRNKELAHQKETFRRNDYLRK